jgi:hypothetical protein
MDAKLAQRLTETTREIQSTEQKLTQVRHKLRMRAQIVEELQRQLKHKELQTEFDAVEALCFETEELKDRLAEQAGHNQLLGQQIDAAKTDLERSLGAGRSDLSVSDLNQVFAELNLEVETCRQKLETQQRAEAQRRQLLGLLTETQKLEQEVSSLEASVKAAADSTEVWRGRFANQAQNLSVLKETQAALADESVSHLEYLKVLEDKLDRERHRQLSDLNAALKQVHESRRQRAADLQRVAKALPSQELSRSLAAREVEDEELTVHLLKRAFEKVEGWTVDLLRLQHLARHQTLTVKMRTDEEADRLEVLERLRVADLCRESY